MASLIHYNIAHINNVALKWDKTFTHQY